jgi:hypothetical protein
LLNSFGKKTGFSTHISAYHALIVGAIVAAIYSLLKAIFLKLGLHNTVVQVASSEIETLHTEKNEAIILSSAPKRTLSLSFFYFITTFFSTWLIGSLVFHYQGFSLTNSIYLSLNQYVACFFLGVSIVPALLLLSCVTCCACCCCCFCCGTMDPDNRNIDSANPAAEALRLKFFRVIYPEDPLFFAQKTTGALAYNRENLKKIDPSKVAHLF